MFRRLARGISALLVAAALLFFVITIFPIDNYLIGRLAGPWNDPKGEILIVLGAESMNDAMGPSSYMRAIYAMRAWRAGGFRKIVISGGSSNGGAPIAEPMREFLVCQGVPAQDIVLEEQSHNTHENAVYTTRLLSVAPGTKVLLTSDYHMYRAYRAFRKAGLAVEPRPFPESAKRINDWLLRWPVFLDLCREMGKSAYYCVRGWI